MKSANGFGGVMARPVSAVEVAAYGLAISYLVSDTEELIAYAESSRWLGERLPGWLPVPQWMREGASQGHVNLGVALIGSYWVGAALDGRRTGGHAPFFQDALLAWGGARLRPLGDERGPTRLHQRRGHGAAGHRLLVVGRADAAGCRSPRSVGRGGQP